MLHFIILLMCVSFALYYLILIYYLFTSQTFNKQIKLGKLFIPFYYLTKIIK